MWTRDFVLSFGINFLVPVVFYLLMTLMALHAVDRFQAADSMVGLAPDSFVLGSLLARLFVGRLLDVVGRRRMLIASLVVFIVVAIADIPSQNLWLLLALRLVHGVAYGAGITAQIGLVMLFSAIAYWASSPSCPPTPAISTWWAPPACSPSSTSARPWPPA